MTALDPATWDAIRDGCKRSAAAVLPVVFEEIGGVPEAVLDVGGGEGHWLDAAAALGVGHVWLADLEGDGPFHWDAEARQTLPSLYAVPGKRWPLALCLETAEHVSPGAGAHLLAELTNVADLVLWSAAIPGQGGDGHVNEAWPEAWAEGFDSLGWRLEDPFRDRLWMAADVEPWYRQNLLLARPGRADRGEWPRPLVDPATWAHHRGVPAP